MVTLNLLNQSSVTEFDVQAFVSAEQQQLDNDFTPAYQASVTLTEVFDNSGINPLIVLIDDATIAGALGYHTIDTSMRPIGFVFTQTTINAGFTWQSTASHEILELLADPFINLTALGKAPRGASVFYDYEICDPVENDVYYYDGIEVSNFVLPAWFVSGNFDPAPTQFDFLGNLTAAHTMTSGGAMTFTRMRGRPITRFAKKRKALNDKLKNFHHEQKFGKYSRRGRRHGKVSENMMKGL